MNILYVCRLSDSKLKEKLSPLLQAPHIEHVYVLRDFPGIAFNDRVTYLYPKKATKGIIRHILKVFKGVAYCRKYNIHAVLGVLNTPHGYIGKAISILTRLPYIHVTIAGHREFWLEGKLMEKLNAFLFKRAAFVMVTGNQTKKYLLDKGFDSKRVVILPNIPDDAFLNISHVPSIKERECDIIFMSRIDKNKNLELLLKALSILKERKYSPSVWVVGDGPDLERMHELVSTLGLTEFVDFKGYVSKLEEKMATYKKGKIFVSCSKGEGFPVSLIEAMCCGCVPVISNVGDIVDAVEQGVDGYVYEDTDNPAELAEYLCQLFEDDSSLMKMSEKARRINTKISVDRNSEIWNGVFSKLIDKK